MNKTSKRLLALALSVSMVLSCWPVAMLTAVAEDVTLTSLTEDEINALVNGGTVDSLSETSLDTVLEGNLDDTALEGSSSGTSVESNNETLTCPCADGGDCTCGEDCTCGDGCTCSSGEGSGESVTTTCATCGNEPCTCSSGESSSGEGSGEGDGEAVTTTCATCGSETCTCTAGECTCTAEICTCPVEGSTQDGSTEEVDTEEVDTEEVDTEDVGIGQNSTGNVTNGDIAVIEDDDITAGQAAADPDESTTTDYYGASFTINVLTEADTTTGTYGTCEIIDVVVTATDGKVIIPATLTQTDGKTYTVIGIASYDWSNEYTGNVFYGNTAVKEITFETGSQLEYIGGWAFQNCANLVSVTLPDSITALTSPDWDEISAGSPAVFSGCTSLTTINIPASLTTIPSQTFYGCASLGTVTIGEGLTEIGSSAFYGCTSLTSISLPRSLTTIDSRAFASSGLTSISLPATILYWSTEIFKGCTNLQTVTFGVGFNAQIFTETYDYNENGASFVMTMSGVGIPDSTFYSCSTLNTISIPDAMASIGDYAFYGCSMLQSIKIPDAVVTIGSQAFYNCTTLNLVTIDEYYSQLTTIGGSAFYNCNQLKAFTFPAQLTMIDTYAFSYAYNLKTLTVSEEITGLTIGNSAFLRGATDMWGYRSSSYETELDDSAIALIEKAIYIGNNAFASAVNIDGKITFSDDLTYIGAYAFYNCTNIEISFTDDATLATIGNYAFSGCTGITGALTIPAATTSIGDYAFYNCTGISGTLTITENTEGATQTIGESAFSGCSSLEKVNIPITVTSIGENAFFNCSALTAININKGKGSISGASWGAAYAVVYWKGTMETVEFVYDPYYLTDEATGTLTNDALVVTVSSSGLVSDSGTEYTAVYLSSDQLIKYSRDVAIPAFITYDNETSTVTTVTYRTEDADGNVTYTAYTMATSITENTDGTIAETDIKTELTGTVTMGTDGKLSYSGTEDPFGEGTTYYVYAISENAFYGSTMTSITIPDTINEIGEGAFSSCNGIKTVDLPDFLTEIPNKLFENSTALASIIIKDTVTSIGDSAFKGCSSLSAVAIPSSVTYIGSEAFQACTELASITIPSSVDVLGISAFEDCTKLDTLTFETADDGTGLQAILASAFDNCIALENITWGAVESIGTSAFYNCNALTSLDFSDTSVNAIGTSAFSNCSYLASVTFADGTIGSSAFYLCTRLETINLGSVTSIGASAFAGYYAGNVSNQLITVTIPATVQSIESSAFAYCTNLKTVIYADGSPITRLAGSTFRYCYKLETINIPSGVTDIDNYAFQYCSQLDNVTLPDGLTMLDSWAFQYCTSLTSINIPASANGYSSIGMNVFDGCTSLADVTIEEGVMGIGSYMFQGCTALTQIIIPTTVTSIGGYAFNDCTNLATVTFTGVSLSGASIRTEACCFFDYNFGNCISLTTITLPAASQEMFLYTFDGCTNLSTIYIDDTYNGFYASEDWGALGTTDPDADVYYLQSSILYTTSVTENDDGTRSIYLSLSSKAYLSRVYYPVVGETAPTDLSGDDGDNSFNYDSTKDPSQYISKSAEWNNTSSPFKAEYNGTYTFYALDANGNTVEITVTIDDIGTPTVTASSIAVQESKAQAITTESALLALVGAQAYLPYADGQPTVQLSEVVRETSTAYSGLTVATYIDETQSSSVGDSTASTLFSTTNPLTSAAEGKFYLVTITVTDTDYNKTATTTVVVEIVSDEVATLLFVDSEDLVNIEDDAIPTTWITYTTVIDEDNFTIYYEWENSHTGETTDYDDADYLGDYDYYDNTTGVYKNIEVDVTTPEGGTIATADPAYIGLQQPVVTNYVFSHWEITIEAQSQGVLPSLNASGTSGTDIATLSSIGETYNTLEAASGTVSTSGTAYIVTATAVMVSALDLTVPETGLQTDEALWFGITVAAGMLFILNNKKKRIKREET